MLPVFAIVFLLAVAPPALAQTRDAVVIDGDFAIDRSEVSIGRFDAFVAARGLETKAEREGGGFEYVGGWQRRPGWTWRAPFGDGAGRDEPAVHVTWSEARDFCAWAGGRLPTLDEWRRAAYTETRAQPTDGFVRGRTYVYPVGERPEGMNTNRRRHVAVGTTRAGVNGLHDMGANVWEWAADRRGDEAMTTGGSWWYGPEMARAEGAQWKPADFTAVYIGFRCVYAAGG